MSSEQVVVTLLLAGPQERPTFPLREYLQSTGQVHLEITSGRLPSNLGAYRAVVLADPAGLTPEECRCLDDYVRGGGGCLSILLAPDLPVLPLFGVSPGQASSEAEMVLRLVDSDSTMLRRLPPEYYLRDRLRPLHTVSSGVRPILTTTWHYQEVPLATLRQYGAGSAAALSLQDFGDPFVQQFTYRLIRHLGHLQDVPDKGLGIVGYGPIARLHGLAAREVPGLELRAICDLDPARLEQARSHFPGVPMYHSARDLAQDQGVDLVVLATPPNTHSEMAVEFLREGKHVVCEKPLCLTTEEAATMIEVAKDHGKVLSCHQNRRWDVDYLAIRQALLEGLIGEPFYLELFIGEYQHPCHYWHSHQPICGGALYDWGAHYVDWILNLFHGQATSVVGTEHKRVWHDVTNADQARAQIRFSNGQEGEFLYSQIAALRKPKWYILGTEGAIVGHWNDVTVQEADALYYLREERIPPTETVPLLILRRRHPSGQMLEQQIALPRPRRHSYHLNLADHLLTGEPLAVTAESAARVVAVLEAASRSAEHGGVVEVLSV